MAIKAPAKTFGANAKEYDKNKRTLHTDYFKRKGTRFFLHELIQLPFIRIIRVSKNTQLKLIH